jgi:hypothetical protein
MPNRYGDCKYLNDNAQNGENVPMRFFRGVHCRCIYDGTSIITSNPHSARVCLDGGGFRPQATPDYQHETEHDQSNVDRVPEDFHKNMVTRQVTSSQIRENVRGRVATHKPRLVRYASAGKAQSPAGVVRLNPTYGQTEDKAREAMRRRYAGRAPGNTIPPRPSRNTPHL